MLANAGGTHSMEELLCFCQESHAKIVQAEKPPPHKYCVMEHGDRRGKRPGFEAWVSRLVF